MAAQLTPLPEAAPVLQMNRCVLKHLSSKIEVHHTHGGKGATVGGYNLPARCTLAERQLHVHE